ncbi:MAG: 30S ribosomal protein S9 [Patescibacteria group bacterium]|nr:30S ribosomal protein S9 [Patescibacteria group bacterium]
MEEETILDEKEIEEVKEDKEEIIHFPSIGKNKYIEAIGRRKRAVARVRIFDNLDSKNKDQFEIIVNNKPYENYFQVINLKKIADTPLRKLRIFGIYKIIAKVQGGGLRGQADALKLGIARALVKINSEWKLKLKKSGLLTRDPRKKERKKYGLKKARKAPQWHKR